MSMTTMRVATTVTAPFPSLGLHELLSLLSQPPALHFLFWESTDISWLPRLFRLLNPKWEFYINVKIHNVKLH